ncbi:hypothetical protein C5468_03150 [Photorhabdus luminescens subsp. mexicana]|uniref:Uncharacterized protein n=1 Tax=Photorhabdus luminescens subsp. mexicana TaxID=2100167 RepID=A0A4R4JNP4_PHOLU|nr:hypothetical protein C5468_03150 [Photorhabdus luminescens subsp. mexicana]
MLSNVLFWILEYLKSLVVLGNVGSRIKYISECPKKALQLRGMTPIKYFMVIENLLVQRQISQSIIIDWLNDR